MSVDVQAVAVVFEGTAGVSGKGEGVEDEPSRLRLAKDAVAGLPTVITSRRPVIFALIKLRFAAVSFLDSSNLDQLLHDPHSSKIHDDSFLAVLLQAPQS